MGSDNYNYDLEISPHHLPPNSVTCLLLMYDVDDVNVLLNFPPSSPCVFISPVDVLPHPTDPPLFQIVLYLF